MKQLLIIRDQDVITGAPKVDSSNFTTRTSARAVVLNDADKVYLLRVSNHNYHKLPGGGIEEGEDTQTALARELMEEIGVKAENIAELGEVIEYRDQFELVQTSYCFVAKQLGKQGKAALEAGELADGMYEVKAKNIDDAIKILQEDNPTDYEGHFIRLRDLTILKAARDLLDIS